MSSRKFAFLRGSLHFKSTKASAAVVPTFKKMMSDAVATALAQASAAAIALGTFGRSLGSRGRANFLTERNARRQRRRGRQDFGVASRILLARAISARAPDQQQNRNEQDIHKTSV
jgi:hypothetical protein